MATPKIEIQGVTKQYHTNRIVQALERIDLRINEGEFVCLVGPSLKTLDAMQAFVQSVHLVLNPADLPNLGPILKKGLAEFELLYRAYKDIYASMGEK